MREIIFRGKRTDGAGWIYGDLLHPLNPETQGHYIVPIGSALHRMTEVASSTVGQFTGLTDKNGKRIFEGDIIRILYEADSMPENVPETWAELYEVVFDDEHHAWFTKLDNGELGEWLYEYDGDCEVIGNIHDNAALAKEGEAL